MGISQPQCSYKKGSYKKKSVYWEMFAATYLVECHCKTKYFTYFWFRLNQDQGFFACTCELPYFSTYSQPQNVFTNNFGHFWALMFGFYHNLHVLSFSMFQHPFSSGFLSRCMKVQDKLICGLWVHARNSDIIRKTINNKLTPTELSIVIFAAVKRLFVRFILLFFLSLKTQFLWTATKLGIENDSSMI